MLNSYELSVLASVADGNEDHDMLTLDRLKAEGYIRGNLLTLRFDLTENGRDLLKAKNTEQSVSPDAAEPRRLAEESTQEESKVE